MTMLQEYYKTIQPISTRFGLNDPETSEVEAEHCNTNNINKTP